MNGKLKELISISRDDATSDDDKLLVSELKKAEMIMPIEIISHDDDLEFKPLKIADPDNNEFVALFSDEDELLKANAEFEVINISTENLAEMIGEDNEYYGVAINPFSEYSLAIPLNEFTDLF